MQHDVRLFDTNCTESLFHLYHSLIMVMVIPSCWGRVVLHLCDNHFWSLFSPFSLPDLARHPPAFSIVPTDRKYGTGFSQPSFPYHHHFAFLFTDKQDFRAFMSGIQYLLDFMLVSYMAAQSPSLCYKTRMSMEADVLQLRQFLS